MPERYCYVKHEICHEANCLVTCEKGPRQCGCCGKEKEIEGVASLPGLPMSIAWCRDCLIAQVTPYHACVTMFWMCGMDMSHMDEWASDLIARSLVYHGKTLDDLKKDAKETDEAYEKYCQEEHSRMEDSPEAMGMGDLSICDHDFRPAPHSEAGLRVNRRCIKCGEFEFKKGE